MPNLVSKIIYQGTLAEVVAYLNNNALTDIQIVQGESPGNWSILANEADPIEGTITSTATEEIVIDGFNRVRVSIIITGTANVFIRGRASVNDPWEILNENETAYNATEVLNITNYGFNEIQIDATITAGSVSFIVKGVM